MPGEVAMSEIESPPGVDSGPSIFLMENHDAAYQIWRAAGVQEKILVHIDAHEDLWFIPDHSSLHIGNFISLALQENIVKEIYWVVPDQTWEDSRSLQPVIRRLKKVLTSYPGNSLAVRVERHQLSAAVLGKPLRVLTLDNLPRFSEDVLLDIDVDFLLIPKACSGVNYDRGPWCWPGDLVARLQARGLQSDLVTLAYSVEGGYTPLKWKYLGDELALRLRRSGVDDSSLRGMALMREATQAVTGRDYQLAEEKYQQALNHWASAAPHLHLMHLYLDMGETSRARLSYQRALAIDPAYRTAYNSAGHHYFIAGLLRQAEQEHRRTLSLDPEDAYAYLGLGHVAAQRKRWHEAEAWLRKALALAPNLVDAYRTLGEVHARLGRVEAAIAAYERSLILALKGHKPLSDYIATEYPGLADLDHFRIHGRLARLYDKQGEVAKAISGYRMSIAKGGDGVFPRTRLAHLYLKQGQWRLSASEAGLALKMAPGEVYRAGRRFRKASRRFRRRLIEMMASRPQACKTK